jgi:hypothetical protein
MTPGFLLGDECNPEAEHTLYLTATVSITTGEFCMLRELPQSNRLPIYLSPSIGFIALK